MVEGIAFREGVEQASSLELSNIYVKLNCLNLVATFYSKVKRSVPLWFGVVTPPPLAALVSKDVAR